MGKAANATSKSRQHNINREKEGEPRLPAYYLKGSQKNIYIYIYKRTMNRINTAATRKGEESRLQPNHPQARTAKNMNNNIYINKNDIVKSVNQGFPLHFISIQGLQDSSGGEGESIERERVSRPERESALREFNREGGTREREREEPV